MALATVSLPNPSSKSIAPADLRPADGLSSKRNKKKKTWKTSNETESEAWTGPTSTAAQPTSTGIDQRRGYSPSVPLPFSNIVRERIRALYGELNPTVTAVDRFGIDAVELDGDNAVKERQEGEPYRTKARDRDDDDQAEVRDPIPRRFHLLQSFYSLIVTMNLCVSSNRY